MRLTNNWPPPLSVLAPMWSQYNATAIPNRNEHEVPCGL